MASSISIDKPGQKDARAQYLGDFLRRARNVASRNKVLRRQAPGRIAAAVGAAKKANLKNDATDDPLDQYHVVQRFLEEKAFYPLHDKRTESSAYAAIHKAMTIVQDQPCLVCQVRHSTLGEHANNPFGAVQLETHHHTIEWALANAIVPESFNAHVLPGLARRAAERRSQGKPVDPIYKEFDALYNKPMTADQIKQWVDHSPDNLWVLCDVHHRHKFVGIHAITYPIWGPQDLVDANIVNSEIAALGRPTAEIRPRSTTRRPSKAKAAKRKPGTENRRNPT